MKISAKEYMTESFVPINNIIKIDLISNNTKFLSVHHSIFFLTWILSEWEESNNHKFCIKLCFPLSFMNTKKTLKVL